MEKEADRKTKIKIPLDQNASRVIRWIGSTSSIVAHTILFAVAFTLPFFGISFDKVLLILTTAVSLEAIYLAIFIQMSVNKNTESLEEVEEDIDELQEEIDEIGEDVDEIIEEEKNDNVTDEQTHKILGDIQARLESLLTDIEKLKKTQK